MNITVNGIEPSNNKKVLLLPPEDFDPDDAEIVVKEMRNRFPECEWSILTGGFNVLVLSKDEE